MRDRGGIARFRKQGFLAVVLLIGNIAESPTRFFQRVMPYK